MKVNKWQLSLTQMLGNKLLEWIAGCPPHFGSVRCATRNCDGSMSVNVHHMDISRNLSRGTSASSFADDTKLQRNITKEEDWELLQADLDRVYFCSLMQLSLNLSGSGRTMRMCYPTT